jgi:hypothetical protein
LPTCCGGPKKGRLTVSFSGFAAFGHPARSSSDFSARKGCWRRVVPPLCAPKRILYQGGGRHQPMPRCRTTGTRMGPAPRECARNAKGCEHREIAVARELPLVMVEGACSGQNCSTGGIIGARRGCSDAIAVHPRSCPARCPLTPHTNLIPALRSERPAPSLGRHGRRQRPDPERLTYG